MIQRIQTIYLLISALIMGALYLWFPVITDTDGNVILDRSELVILIPVFLSIALAIISILNFKKRQMQFVLNRLNILLSLDRKSTRLNSSHVRISYAVFCLKKKKIKK